MKRFPIALLAALAVAPLLQTRLAALPAAEAEAGRAIVAHHADTVIEVELVVVVRVSVGDKAQPPREIKREINGTVIAPSGLTVVSLGSIDPMGSMRLPPNMKVEDPEYKEVKLRLSDNTEIPARIVLKDEDLDVAFIAPDPAVPERKFAHADLAAPARAELLGTYFDLSRAQKHLQRTPAIRVVEAIGIVEKPRQLVLLSAYSPGCPVFDAEGRLLGISVRHTAEGRETGLILLPTASIAELAPAP
ncbi:MAG TPA: hypothetical protein VK178_10150 [Opitutaceae bacterium]|nr:hypothetical protein [Opitutaceae bacterium]